MYRTHTCGELSLQHKGKKVVLSGWIKKIRNKGKLVWIDLRDRYGVTQLFFSEEITSPDLFAKIQNLGREYVVKIEGDVVEREAKNPQMPTGDIEIQVSSLEVLSSSEVPPFTIEDDTDGGDEIRMQYRYLDLRRNPMQENMILRHRMAQEFRKYLDKQDFLEIETPYLIKSTPEGARDFVVPSRMNPTEFYALPQSPQTFKQLLMISGYDRYFQLVKCFRDEDLRADRQPEFTQIDCEMSFVEQEDILQIFEGMMKHLFKTIKGIDIKEDFPRISYQEAMDLYGSDKPDTRFDMKFVELKAETDKRDFGVFNSVPYVAGICAKNCASYSRKELDKLIDFVKKPQIGAKGLVYVKCNEDGTFKSSVDKFYTAEDLKEWANKFNAQAGDLLLIMAGERRPTQIALSELRLEMGTRLGLRDPQKYAALWVVDFPLLEWDEDAQRFHAMHHPFTSPKKEDAHLLQTAPEKVRANAYDMVINGSEIGGGSIRIHDRKMQKQMFKALGFTDEEAQKQFGFLLDAFQYGAPPHGGIALGFDRMVAMFSGKDSIRDFIAFPKNNSGRDVMIDSPSTIAHEQLEELSLAIKQMK